MQLFEVRQFSQKQKHPNKKLIGGSFEAMLLIITLIFLLLYAGLIFYYFYYWLRIKEYNHENKPSTFVSVVVAARNEEKNIECLLKGLQNQTYPAHLYEIIIVDDFSTDRTAEVVKNFPFENLLLINPDAVANQSSKKKAIEAGVQKAKGEIILITDADCFPPEKWLHTIVSFQHENEAVFIAAPVKLKSYFTLLSMFQSLDFITLQGITAASVKANFHSMCNGANLAYKKTSFFEVDGFKGIDKRASGDDMLLMYKIWKRHPSKVRYLKSRKAIIETEPMKNWKTFFQQRIRWSSKATYYQDYRVSSVLLFVYLFNCLFFVLLANVLFHSAMWWLVLLYFAGKVIIEIPFVFSVAQFYKEQKLLLYFPFLQPLHITYTVVIGFISQFGKYEWKGRKTK